MVRRPVVNFVYRWNYLVTIWSNWIVYRYNCSIKYRYL